MRRIVISGINFESGGPLSVMRDALSYLSKELSNDFEIIALVHSKLLYEDIEKITFIEFIDSRSSWVKRIYYEYFYFKKLSQKMDVYLWLSMHDITPNVVSHKKAVYCHNPSPFYKMSKLEKKMDKKLMLFNLFYKYLYQINIRYNDFVIVQQEWLREEFKKLYHIKNVIVAYPNIDLTYQFENVNEEKEKKIFFYAAFPRVFKNFEIICEVATFFSHRDDVEFIITINGTENKYAKYLYQKYGKLKNLKFVGLLTRNEVFRYYEISDALIFPSKLETWGLPITEYKQYNKPIFLANLKYAKETIGNYDKVKFFNVDDPNDLKQNIEQYLDNKLEFDITKMKKIKSLFTQGWKELFELLLKEE